jgi:hypothetical protein
LTTRRKSSSIAKQDPGQKINFTNFCIPVCHTPLKDMSSYTFNPSDERIGEPLVIKVITLLMAFLLVGWRSLPSERVTLSTGDMLYNEPYVTWNFGDGEITRDQYYFVATGTNTKELINRVGTGNHGTLYGMANLRAQKRGEKVALFIDGHVYRRAMRHDGPFWHHWNLGVPNQGLTAFFRSVASGVGEDPRYSWQALAEDAENGLLGTHYRTDRVNFEKNVLILSKRDPRAPWPQEVALSTMMWDSPSYSFDFIETERLNHGLRVNRFPANVRLTIRGIIARVPSADVTDRSRSSFEDLMTLPHAELVYQDDVLVQSLQDSVVSVLVKLKDASIHSLDFKVRGLWQDLHTPVVAVHVEPELVVLRRTPWLVELNKDYLFLRLSGGSPHHTYFLVLRFRTGL